MPGLAGEPRGTREQGQALLGGEPLARALLSWPHCSRHELAGFEAEQAHLHEWPWPRSRAKAWGGGSFDAKLGTTVRCNSGSLAGQSALLAAPVPWAARRFSRVSLPLPQLFLLLLACVPRGF